MADDCNSEPILSLSEETSRNSEISATLNMPYHTHQDPPKSSSSEVIHKVVQEMAHNPVTIPDYLDLFFLEKADSFKSRKEQDNTDSHELENNVGKAGDAFNDTDSLVNRPENGMGEEREKVGNNTCLKSAVLEKEEKEEKEKGENGCGSSDNVVLGKGESNLDTCVTFLGNREKGVSGILERLAFDDKMSGNANEGSLKKCSLKISVIDETALIESSEIGEVFRERNIVKNVNYNEQENGGNRDKKTRRKGRKTKSLGTDGGDKNLEFSQNDRGIGMLEGFEEKRQKYVYSRKQLEGLRHVELDTQRKKWAEIYCGLGPVVQKEYDGLVGYDYHHQYYNQKQKKFIRVDSNETSTSCECCAITASPLFTDLDFLVSDMNFICGFKLVESLFWINTDMQSIWL